MKGLKKELKAFDKIFIKTGEKKVFKFQLKDEAFAFWDDTNKKWKIEPGKFEILIGKSSRDILLKKEIHIK